MDQLIAQFNRTGKLTDTKTIDLEVKVYAYNVTETARLIKAYGIRIEITSPEFPELKGIEWYRPRNGLNLPKKDWTQAKPFKVNPKLIDKLMSKAFTELSQQWLMKQKKLKGKVLYFDRLKGKGRINIEDLGTYSVYACNLKGKKTWYAETACTYLEPGQNVIIDHLAEVGSGLTCIINEDVKFDQDKWDSLNQDRLPFKCNEDGEVINGLFSNK